MPDFTMCANSYDCPKARDCQRSVANTEPARIVLTTDDVLNAIQRFDGVRLAKRTLAQWAQAGVVVPSIDWRQVRRAPRLYSYADLGRARLVVRLTRQLGMTLQDARFVLAALDAHADSPLHELLRPANARKAKALEAVFVVRAGRWRAALVSVGDTDYTLSGDAQAQARFQFGTGEEFRFKLADVVKDYKAIEKWNRRAESFVERRKQAVASGRARPTARTQTRAHRAGKTTR